MAGPGGGWDGLVIRFTQRVERRGPNDCWEWKGSVMPDGYGQIGATRNVKWRSNRLAWTIANGREIPAGMFICHRCDNPLCCNPAHLFLGTPGDNIEDAWDKRRLQHGEQRANAKLTDEAVRDIRRRVANGQRHKDIADIYGVSRTRITRVANGKVWRHVE